MMRSCISAAPAAQATTTKSSAASASASLVAQQHRRRSIACRSTSSSSSSSRPIDTHEEGNDSALRTRRAMLAQGASLAAAALALAPLSAIADDEIVVDAAAAASEVAPAPAAAAPAAAAPAALDVEFATLSDKTLAYSFRYPVSVAKTGSSNIPPPPSSSSSAAAPPPNALRLALVPSRRPERYSSAAPLSADARQRIVCELVDLQQSVTVSVTVGPPATAAMLLPPDERRRLGEAAASSSASSDPGSWSPRAVAEAVLVDRSTARTTSGQRLALNSVEKAEALSKEVKGGTSGGTGGGNGGGSSSGSNKSGTTSGRYFLYEHLAQGSPSERSVAAAGGGGAKETFRHAWASTGVRYSSKRDANPTPYLYTLNLSCPQDLWPLLGDAFRAAAESFELDAEPGEGFVSPDSQPWRFF